MNISNEMNVKMNLGQWQDYMGPWAKPLGVEWFWGLAGIGILFLVAWSVVWKGMALWRAARRGDTPWFVVLLLANTVGILDILYLYVFSRKSSAVPPAEHDVL